MTTGFSRGMQSLVDRVLRRWIEEVQNKRCNTSDAKEMFSEPQPEPEAAKKLSQRRTAERNGNTCKVTSDKDHTAMTMIMSTNTHLSILLLVLALISLFII